MTEKLDYTTNSETEVPEQKEWNSQHRNITVEKKINVTRRTFCAYTFLRLSDAGNVYPWDFAAVSNNNFLSRLSVWAMYAGTDCVHNFFQL